MRRLAIASILFFAVGLPFAGLEAQSEPEPSGDPADSSILSKKRKIRRLADEKRETLRVIEKIRNDETHVLDLLADINDRIQESSRKIAMLKAQIGRLNETIRKTKTNVGVYRKRIETDGLAIGRQVEALFYLKKVFNLTPMLGLRTFERLPRNRWILKKNAMLNLKRMKRHEKDVAALQTEESKLARQLKRRSELAAQEREQNELLNFEKRQQSTYLMHIRKDRTLRIKYLQAIQVEAENLNDIVHSAESQKEREKRSETFEGFRNLKGPLFPPVKGKVVSRFGKAQTAKRNLFKRGVLIETADSEEVSSILEGKVAFAGPFRGYERIVILDHGRGSFSIYGNLKELFVRVGEIVDAQVSLGVVAMDAESESYLFYFETRKNKKPVDPLQWFEKDAWE